MIKREREEKMSLTLTGSAGFGLFLKFKKNRSNCTGIYTPFCKEDHFSAIIDMSQLKTY